MRRSEKAFGAPERIIEIGAVAFELGGEATVNHGGATALIKEITHKRRRRLLPFYPHTKSYRVWACLCLPLCFAVWVKWLPTLVFISWYMPGFISSENQTEVRRNFRIYHFAPDIELIPTINNRILLRKS